MRSTCRQAVLAFLVVGQMAALTACGPDYLADEAIRSIKANRNRPFFMYFAPNAPHTPLRLAATAVTATEALLAFGPDVPRGAATILNLSPRGDLAEAAANLFAMLRALDERTYRSSLIAERILEAMQEGTITVATEGERVGQINALSVADLGDIAFGRPSRVTCVTSAGRGSLVMVERESDMAGRIHNKGFLILRGFLAHRFGQDEASLFHASLTFEQLYSDIDGDSASSTELYALLSSLSELPIDQRVAVTGSVDQLGNIQPIGGAAAKIEGFFDVCRARKLTGRLAESPNKPPRTFI